MPDDCVPENSMTVFRILTIYLCPTIKKIDLILIYRRSVHQW